MDKEKFKEQVQPFLEQYAQEVYEFSLGLAVPRKKTSWNASDFGRCLRGVYYEREGEKVPKQLQQYTKNIFHEGKMKELELIIQTILKGYKILDAQQLIYDKVLDVSGHPDLVYEDNGQIIVQEIKTVNSRSFWYRVKTQGDTTYFEPYPEHLGQLTFYLHHLKNTYGMHTKGKITYRSRDDGTTFEIMIDEKPDIWNKIKLQFSILQNAWKEKNPPPVPDLYLFDEKTKRWRVNYVAQFCDYHEYCTEDKDWLKKAKTEVDSRNQKLKDDKIKGLKNK